MRAHVRYGAHLGHKSDMARLPSCATLRPEHLQQCARRLQLLNKLLGALLQMQREIGGGGTCGLVVPTGYSFNLLGVPLMRERCRCGGIGPGDRSRGGVSSM